MSYNDFNYNAKIQKISSSVIRGLNSGKDPFAEMLKEAQKENLTPNLIKAAVQHINNEIFLNHYTRGGEEKIQVIDPEKVIEALNIKEEFVEKTASHTYVNDYWDLKKKNVLFKVAGKKYENPSDKNRINSIRAIAEMKRKATDKKTEFDLYSQIVRMASDIQEEKKRLYNETLLSLRRLEVPVEEIDFVYKTTPDKDVKEVLELAIKRCGIKPKNDLMKDSNLFDEFEVNSDSPILQQVNNIMKKKASLNKLIKKYKELNN